MEPTQSTEPTPPHRVKKEFKIDIFRGWCKSCGICAAFCPQQCIKLEDDGTPYVEDTCRCTGCGWCELHCPDFAVSVHEKELKKPIEQED